MVLLGQLCMILLLSTQLTKVNAFCCGTGTCTVQAAEEFQLELEPNAERGSPPVSQLDTAVATLLLSVTNEQGQAAFCCGTHTCT